MGSDRHRIVIASYSPDEVVSRVGAWWKQSGVSMHQVEPDALEQLALGSGDIIIADFATTPTPGRLPLDTSALTGHLVLGLFVSLTAPEFSSHQERCTEVAVWPGEEREMVAKLERLRRLACLDSTLTDELTIRLDTIGESPVFLEVFTQARKFARSDAPILLTGETGTGKEKVARIIHYLGAQDAGPFVAVNCGGLPDALVENELFGHVKGAYTDAGQAQRGLVEQADGGTLFLDEIETLTHKGQVALLRFLQDYEYRPLGAATTKRARLRLVTATNSSLQALTDAGEFRKDLFYRLNILSLIIPPLRERGEDAVLLAEYFLDCYRERYGQPEKYLSSVSLEWIRRNDWPGNVRELENLLLREFLLTDEACISLPASGDAAAERRKGGDRRNKELYVRSLSDAKAKVVNAFERGYLEHALEVARGNVSQAARLAGKDRRTFTRLMEKHGLHRALYVNRDHDVPESKHRPAL